MENKHYKIKSNVQIFEDIFKMKIDSSEVANSAKAGQFVHIRVNDTIQPFLRRPFSIHRINQAESEFEVLYRIIGEGTKQLSNKRDNETISVLGPVGNGFTIDNSFEYALVVAGGMGIAPIYFLLDELQKKDKKITLLWGASTEGEIFSSAEAMQERGITVKFATEDGSLGHTGFITDLIKDAYSDMNNFTTKGFTCGPAPMLTVIQSYIKDSRIEWEASLEERMACGIGVCAGCSVKTIHGEYKLVCKDGPVMNLREIECNG